MEHSCSCFRQRDKKKEKEREREREERELTSRITIIASDIVDSGK